MRRKYINSIASRSVLKRKCDHSHQPSCQACDSLPRQVDYDIVKF
jgi:hypothetical protein